MEYLFLKRKKTSSTSVRQKDLLYRAASRRWEKEFASQADVRPADTLYIKVYYTCWRCAKYSSIPLFR